MRTPAEALLIAIASGLESDEVDDKAAWVEEQLSAFREHLSAAGKNSQEGRNMDKSFRKLLIDAGPVGTIRKSIYNEALVALGDEARQPGDSDAKAYCRGLETAEGIALHDLYKRAPPDPPQDDVEPEKMAPKGPANVAMERLAAEHLKANPELGVDAFGRPRPDGGKAAHTRQCCCTRITGISPPV